MKPASRCRWCLPALMLLASTSLPAAEPEADFEQEVAPLLIKRCLECHQGKDPSGGLRLDGPEGLTGDSGAAIQPGQPAESYLLQRVEQGEMPPVKQGKPQRLPAAEVATLKRWIEQGATWPRNRSLDLYERTSEVRAGRDWWSLQPVQHPPVPAVQQAARVNNPVDAFILQKLEQQDMQPAPPAAREQLIRRLYVDLLGLPPTREEIQTFVGDNSPLAWEQLVDRLLASPQYGERWARHWLDGVRYADTSGYERDQPKPFAWKYRDWVVKAHNSDLPYDEFIRLQLAGDEFPQRSEQTVIATGFLRLGTWNDEPNIPEDYVYDRLEDLVNATSSTFLGLTVKCARCHDHKFDPIPQADYYRMVTAFWPGPIQPSDRQQLGGPTPDQLGFPDVLGWTDVNPNPAPVRLLKNGEREQPGDVVPPGVPTFLPQVAAPALQAGERSSGRRRQLAEWITDPANPLTARVQVNRLWQHHFGQGLVRSPGNFGFQGEKPTHPELLDWLATELIRADWSLKHIHRLLLLSQTWQQSSLHPLAEAYSQRDAGNRLWWRAERRRLEAEPLRDALLAASGDLDQRMTGPAFLPAIQAEALEGLSRKDSAWQESPPEEQNRRSLYVYSQRSLLVPWMTTLDFPDTTLPCAQRESTTVPTQALALLNNQFVHERSRSLALRIAGQFNEPQARIRQVWRRIYSRDPSPREIALALTHLQRQRQRFAEIWQSSVTSMQAVPQAGLVLHLRANQGVTVDEQGGVSEWQDLSDAENQAFQARSEFRPRLVKEAERTAIRFDGQSHFLSLRNKVLTAPECTILAVVSDQGQPGHREILSNWDGAAGNAGTSLFLGLTDENSVRFSDAFAPAGAIQQRERLFLLAAMNEPHAARVFQNGRLLASRESSLGPRNLRTAWVIGQQGNINGEYWHGDIAEILVYDRPLSAEELRAVNQTLAARHRLEVHPGDNPPLSPEVLALASLCHVLMNSNEFLYVD